MQRIKNKSQKSIFKKCRGFNLALHQTLPHNILQAKPG